MRCVPESTSCKSFFIDKRISVATQTPAANIVSTSDISWCENLGTIGPRSAKPSAGAMPSENCLLLGRVTSNVSLAATKSANAAKVFSSLALCATSLMANRAAAMPRAARAPPPITRSLDSSGLRPIAWSLVHLGRPLEPQRLFFRLFSPDVFPTVPGDGLFQRVQGSLVELCPRTAAELGKGFLY